MTRGAYYNEIDANAAAWLRELIKAGHIAPGDVDTRSILEVTADDVSKYTQAHFFAGIGGWSHALRLAGWPDDRPVWTGSCPCQPFSSAGKQKGTEDERHLWPAWGKLIGECRPGVVFGEQVEAAIRHGWLDLVQADLEGNDYAFGAVGLPAAGFGAPHIRQRLWFVADSNEFVGGQGSALDRGWDTRSDASARAGLGGGFLPSILADAPGERCTGIDSLLRPQEARRGGAQEVLEIAGSCESGDVGHAGSPRPSELGGERDEPARPAPAGFWSDCDWLPCRDGKARPVEPGTFPLAHGLPARVGRLRGYGNAIVPQVAAEFIRAYQETRGLTST